MSPEFRKGLCLRGRERLEEGPLRSWGSGWTWAGNVGRRCSGIIARCVWRMGHRPNGRSEQFVEVGSEGEVGRLGWGQMGG